jgi:hypothetical protein
MCWLTWDGPFANQEAEKKARKQFKGLFDKKPGEISEVGAAEPEGGKASGDAKAPGEATSADRDADTKGSPSGEYAFEEERPGLLGRVWPSARRVFSSLGLNRCTILWWERSCYVVYGKQKCLRCKSEEMRKYRPFDKRDLFFYI